MFWSLKSILNHRKPSIFAKNRFKIHQGSSFSRVVCWKQVLLRHSWAVETPRMLWSVFADFFFKHQLSVYVTKIKTKMADFTFTWNNFRNYQILKPCEFIQENFKGRKTLYKWRPAAANGTPLKSIACTRGNALIVRLTIKFQYISHHGGNISSPAWWYIY